MSVLLSTLKDEFKTVQRLERRYVRSIKALPFGSFVLRKRRCKSYGYLTYRQNGQVKQKYLGSLSGQSIERYRTAMQDKRAYKEKLKNIRAQLKILQRALRGHAT